IGVGAGGGHFGTGKPSVFVSRDRARNTAEGPGGRGAGPTVKSQQAVIDGQRWLVRHQIHEGDLAYWAADKLKDVCDKDGGCCKGGPEYTDMYNEGLTGLALLAFFGSGQTDESKNSLVDTVRAKKSYIGKDVILPALKWLKKRQDSCSDGRFSKDGH